MVWIFLATVSSKSGSSVRTVKAKGQTPVQYLVSVTKNFYGAKCSDLIKA